MGCDIHLYVERRQEDGSWALVSGDEGDFYNGRNYDVFAIFAGVRNRGGWNPISEPRGVPPDASPGYLEIINGYCSHYFVHSHSYLTYSDLTGYDWTQERNGVTAYADTIWFWANTVPELLELGRPEDTRMVFFFDS